MPLSAIVLFAALAKPKVSLDAPFQPSDAVVRSAAERTGEKLSVAPFLAREMVRVRVRDLPLPILLKHLSACTYADWRPIGAKLRGRNVINDQVRPCRRREIEFRIFLPSGYESVSTLQDFTFFPGAGFVPPSGLPRWLKDLVRPPR